MAHCKNEDNSLPEAFESVVLPATQCDTNLLSDINDVSYQVNTTFQQIKDKSEKSRIVYNNVSTLFTDWRTQKLEEIEQIYENHLQRIEFHQEALNVFHQELLTCLKDNATQHLERVQIQQNSNTEVLNHVQQTIGKVRQDSAYSKWKFAIPLPNDIEFSSSNFPRIPIPVHQSTTSRIDKEKQIDTRTTPRRRRRRRASSKVASIEPVELKGGHALKRLVQMFANISSIRESQNAIGVYITNCRRRLVIVVNAYLTAWHYKSSAEKKFFLLHEHISTVKKYSIYRTSDFDVLVGIQLFFSNRKLHKSEIMAYLLQFFLDHDCINQKLILDWYHNNDPNGYIGYEEARQLARPFIESLLINNTGIHAAPINQVISD